MIAQTQNYHYQYLERKDSITKTHTDKGLDILRAADDVAAAFANSQYSQHEKELKNFKILEGIYTYLAYLAFVKNRSTYRKMSQELKIFVQKNNISTFDILSYQRFGRNYLLYLPLKKKIYYLLYFMGQEKLLQKLV